MKPRTFPIRVRQRPLCQLCDFVRQQPANRRGFLSTATKASVIRRQPLRQNATVVRVPTRSFVITLQRSQETKTKDEIELEQSDRIAALRTDLTKVEGEIQAIYDSNKVESEDTILHVLDGLDAVAQQAIAIRARRPLPAKLYIRQSSAGAILSGLTSDEKLPPTLRKTRSKLGVDALPSPSHISRLALDLIKHPAIFISPNILGIYIHLQRLLARPQAIPEALYLYAHKPVPIQGSSPPKFSQPSPKSPKQAIPADLADAALTAAIDAKDMSLALDVIDHTYRTPAWTRHRMLSKLGVPAALAAVMPLALYMIAQELSVYSGYIDPWTFKVYSFLGLSTYVLCTGTLGFVALTTYNDHHDRVVWRPGMPLLDRYRREDERAAMDRIACAWGFKESWRRGDEDGEEWEGLRQLVLVRGMVLDKPDLMPGMNPGR